MTEQEYLWQLNQLRIAREFFQEKYNEASSGDIEDGIGPNSLTKYRRVLNGLDNQETELTNIYHREHQSLRPFGSSSGSGTTAHTTKPSTSGPTASPEKPTTTHTVKTPTEQEVEAAVKDLVDELDKLNKGGGGTVGGNTSTSVGMVIDEEALHKFPPGIRPYIKQVETFHTNFKGMGKIGSIPSALISRGVFTKGH